MRRKLRIFSSIAVICLSVCMFAFGVYAASTVSVTTSGTVSFTATDVYAKITRKVTGASTNPSNLTQTVDSNATDNQEFKMGDNESLQFKNATTNIKIIFTIENLATDRNLDFTITDNTAEDVSTKLTKTVTVKQDSQYGTVQTKYDGTHYNINPKEISGSVQCVIVEFSVKDANSSFDLNYDYTINLSSQTSISSKVTASSSDATVSKVGNVQLIQYEFEANKQLNDYFISGSNYVEYDLLTSENVLSIPLFVYGTSPISISGDITDLEYADCYSDNYGSYYLNGKSSGNLDDSQVYVPYVVSFDDGNVVIIQTCDFQGNQYISYVEMPTRMSSLWSSSFEECSNLGSINLPNNITHLEYNLFYNCTSLSISVSDLPSNLQSIGEYTFGYCSNLSLTSLPEGLETIGDRAFSGCSDGLTTLSIPSSVKSLGENCFESCNLTEITYAGTVEQWNDLNIDNKSGLPSGAVVTCSDGSVTIS